MGNLGAEVQHPGVRKGAWSEEEDGLLRKCIEKYGEGKWHHVPQRAGLRRCRKSCRLRWLNYLSPKINREKFSLDEADLIIRLQNLLGNRWWAPYPKKLSLYWWSLIAGRLPGRTANDIKNYWNSHLSKQVEVEKKKVEPSACAEVIKPRPWRAPLQWIWSRDEQAHGIQQQEEEFGIVDLPTISENDDAWLNCILNGEEEKNAMPNAGNVNTMNLQNGFGIREPEEIRDGELILEGVIGWEDYFLCATTSSS